MKGIQQVCSNRLPGPLQRGENHKNVTIGSLYIFFSRTIELLKAQIYMKTT
jgi:hypothetical protein